MKVLSFFLLILALFLSTGDEGVALTEAKTSGVTPKRGKYVGESFNSRDLYDAYKEIESNYHLVAFAKKSQHLWRTLVAKDDVEVSMMEHESEPNCPYVRLKVVIPAPLKDCWNFLSLENWDESMPKMDPFFEGVDLHGEFTYKNVHMTLARKRTNRILAFGKRDFVFLSVTDEPLEDGTWVSGTVSVDTPTIPREKNYVRAFQDSIAFYKPVTPNETQITIICRIDLNDSDAENGSGGNIPMYIYVKTVGISGARSVISMRNALVEAQKEKTLFDPSESQVQGTQATTTTTRKRGLLPPWIKRSKKQ